jgi:PTS system cellobiose-specific IIA component
LCLQALRGLAILDLEGAKEKLEEARENIIEAHRVQTDAIQEETRGVPSEYSLLFAHAQDTLMTINSEVLIAKELVKIIDSIDGRLVKLEKD